MLSILLNIILLVINVHNFVYSQQKIQSAQSYKYNIALLNMETIRDYQFGEKLSYVLKNEDRKHELTLLPGSTNNNRLVYQGMLFDEDTKIIFLFRDNRLTSISYFWLLEDKDQCFLNKITFLLTTKYGKSEPRKMIPSAKGSIAIDKYMVIKPITNDNKINYQTNLMIELETITNLQHDEKLTSYVLEFRPLDPDQIIKNKTLTEDL